MAGLRVQGWIGAVQRAEDGDCREENAELLTPALVLHNQMCPAHPAAACS